MGSSAVRMAKMCLCTSRQSSRAVSRACRKARRCNSMSQRVRRAGRQRTCKHFKPGESFKRAVSIVKSPFPFRGVSIRGKALDKRAHGIGLTLTNLVKGTLSDPSKIQRFLLADPAQHPNILLGWSGCSSPGQAECRVRIEKVGRRSTFLRSPRRLALFPRNDRSEGGNRPPRGYPTAPSGIRTSRIESPAGDQDADLSFAEFSKEFSLG